MSKFWVQFLALLVFILLVSNLFATPIIALQQTAFGKAVVLTSWMALGWYWGRIFDFVLGKIKGTTQK